MSRRDEAIAVGVDVGGTRLRVAAVDAAGRVLRREVEDRPAVDDPDGFGDALLEALVPLAERLGPGLPVGVGIAAVVGPDGDLVAAPNLPVADLALGRRAGAVFDTPVVVVNDATVACLAEARVGAAVDSDDVVLVTLGTGLGGGALVGGRLLRGATGMAAEFGHIVVADGGRRCHCGNDGCLEAMVSGRAIGEVAAQRLADGRASGALAAEAVVDGAAVARAADAGDPLACEVIDEAGRWLGVGLASLVNVLDPAVILLGGGAGKAMGHRLTPTAAAAMATRVLGHDRREVPPIRPAALGDDAGVVGAALLAADEAS